MLQLKPHRFKTRAEAREEAIQNSLCEVVVVHSLVGTLKSISIQFAGDLSTIPSLKNKKIPGKNFGNPVAEGKIRAMDILFDREIKAQAHRLPEWPTFGAANVHALIICGQRQRSFDLIGVVETVQDWLEPRSKKVGKTGHARGWGIGLVDNDSQVTPTPRHWWQVGTPPEFSRIIIEPWCGFESLDQDFTRTILDEAA